MNKKSKIYMRLGSFVLGVLGLLATAALLILNLFFNININYLTIIMTFIASNTMLAIAVFIDKIKFN